ncbi:MAG: sigma-70 family RNA polymerase sigma factor [Faecalibacterium sp.]|nr:sigma-70 family RNA polymerase sigma factor [Faecalibacterium sp.]
MFLELLQFFATRFLYLALHLEAGSFPRPLTALQERNAFERLAAGDTAAREELIRHNLRLVAHVAKKYYALPGDQDDLISIGTIGLIKAVNTFDSSRKARFSTYASKCIENEIRMNLRHERKTAGTLSLQETIETGKDGTALTVLDVVQDPDCMEEALEQGDEAVRLKALVQRLNGRERQIILLRYGLGGQPPLTQQQTARILGISRSYVSRLETRALTFLQNEFGAEKNICREQMADVE